MTLLVRPATLTDARAIAQIQFDGMRAAYRDIVAPDVLAALDVDRLAADRARMIPERRAQGGEIFVAAADEQPVGFASCGPPRDADIDPSISVELYAIYARADRWRTGIGRALIAAVEAHSLARGPTEQHLWVFERNERARAFYEQVGYGWDGARKPNGMFGGAIEVRYRRSL